MSFERVFILQGVLQIGYPPISYQLRRKDTGEVENFDYAGQAWCEKNTIHMLRYGTHGPVSEYLSDPLPTKDSLDFKAGYEHADTQKNKYAPSATKSEAYRRGWRARWAERRPFKFPEELRADRNAARRAKKITLPP